MKKLFTAIRQGNMEIVKELLQKKPDLIFSVAAPPPQKDNGQSPLQVAIKSSNPEIADYLLGIGADVNFMEDDSVGGTRMPALHDAINATLTFFSYHKPEKSDVYFELLKKMMESGADVHKCDSSGFNAWHHSLHQANRMLDNMHVNIETAEKNGMPCTPEQAKRELELAQARVEELLSLLIGHGSDIHGKAAGNVGETPYSGLSAHEYYIMDISPYKPSIPDRHSIKPILLKLLKYC